MWRHIASNAMTILVVAVFLAGGALLWGQSQYKADGPLAQAICLKVPAGSNMRKVSRNLEERGAISSGSIFRLAADYGDRTQDLKAGAYLVQPKATMGEILDIVTKGGPSNCGTEVVYRIGVTRASVQVRELNPNTGSYEEIARFNPAEDERPEAYERVKAASDTRFRVALAEGVTSWQVVQELNAIDLLTGEIAEIPPEGMLAPDSYEISKSGTRQSVIDRMLRIQKKRLADAWATRVDGLPLDSPEEALVLASIIEKETGVPTERRQVASVFINRLNQGMRLQTDPTVIYGITKGQGSLGRGLRQSELRKKTDWNTYVISGLPPTPIANPGLASIKAALDPDSTPFIFFVADGTGGHAFAVTLAEHNANVAKWRKIEAERANQ